MKLALLGDIALFGCCSTPAFFKEVSECLSGFDFVVGNLETPFSIKRRTWGAKSAYICSDIKNVQLLKMLNIQAVCLANNHMFDYGKEGYETTKRVLCDNNIAFFGTEGKDYCISIKNNNLAFLGFCCYSSNPLKCVPYGKYGINEYDVAFAREKAIDLSKKGYLPILSVHSGIEHINYPSQISIQAARWLADSTPLIYYGHHPHVVQGIESRGQSLIAYSLGNFCVDNVFSSVSKDPIVSLTENNRSSCILSISIEHSRVVSWDIIPIYIGKDKIYVGKGVTRELLDNYTDTIHNLSPEMYDEKRRILIRRYYGERKRNRSFVWYLKRLRPRYIGILLNARRNEKEFQRCMAFHNE